jgi:mono/diheme cytochrome c family protein
MLFLVGIAPDLRALDDGIDGDEWYMERARGGAVRNGNVYMPPFEGVLNQEAMWAIRAYLVSLPKE